MLAPRGPALPPRRRTRLAGAVALACALAGCGVSLDGGAVPDAARADAPPPPPPDAAIDAAPCTGGDARMTSPTGACFLILRTQATYDAAKTACTALGAHLAVLADAQDDAVARALVGTGTAFIGLDDRAAEGNFAWTDGTPRQYTNWYAGEPNDGNGQYPEDCAVIAGGRGGQWDDRPCAPVSGVGGGSYAYLCQR